MNRLSVPIFLQDQDTRPFGVVGIILHQDGCGDTRNHFSGQYPFFGHFIIAVIRYEDLAHLNQIKDPPERLAHIFMLPGQAKTCNQFTSLPRPPSIL